MAMFSENRHPYYPLAVAIPGYVPNSLTTPTILAIFAVTIAVILISSHYAASHCGKRISNSDMATALWFVMCGFIHLGLEGMFNRSPSYACCFNM